MEDEEAYWNEVGEVYAEVVEEDIGLPEIELWDLAKDRVRRRKLIRNAIDKMETEGKSLHDALEQEFYSKNRDFPVN